MNEADLSECQKVDRLLAILLMFKDITREKFALYIAFIYPVNCPQLTRYITGFDVKLL